MAETARLLEGAHGFLPGCVRRRVFHRKWNHGIDQAFWPPGGFQIIGLTAAVKQRC